VSYLGKTAEIEALFPYGMNARLPADAQVLSFNVEGMEENKAGIGNVPKLRLKVDAEGEVSFGNPLTGSVTYYRENGDIEVIGKNNQSVTITKDFNLAVKNATITASVQASMIAATQANVLSAIVNLGVSGGTFRKLVDERIIALYNAHTHADPVSGNTGAPNIQLTPGAQETTNTKAS
jgi:hypothetical protein